METIDTHKDINSGSMAEGAGDEDAARPKPRDRG
jgi:hypothetical protein